jgi:hypothetical protein
MRLARRYLLPQTECGNDVFSGGSYGSNSDQRIHFGLGSATKVDKLQIQWPSGSKQEITVPEVDRIFTVNETTGLLR